MRWFSKCRTKWTILCGRKIKKKTAIENLSKKKKKEKKKKKKKMETMALPQLESFDHPLKKKDGGNLETD